MRVSSSILAAVVLILLAVPSLSRAVGYEPSETCGGCHTDIAEQHAASMHAKAFTNPAFQAQYFKELLPLAEKDSGLIHEAKACIACHAPIASLSQIPVASPDRVEPGISGVTCDLCHTISGYKGERPGNGNYISEPRQTKLGPFESGASWHAGQSELHTKSEFCGICHNATNRLGLETRSTYSEWKGSRYASEGVQCQDCHMSLGGVLNEGQPAFDSGRAAFMTLGQAPKRDRLYSHLFPGAHSRGQVARSVAVEMEHPSSATAGQEMSITVLVNNSATGHKMPSGSAELRLLWIELSAVINGKTTPVTASPASGTGFDLAGKGTWDRELLGDIPEGSRIYRAVFADREGKQTLSSYNAEKIIFDNRLNPSEVRRESYTLRLPAEAKGTVSLIATLRYLPYPAPFAARLGLPQPKAVEVSIIRKELTLR